MMSLDERLRDAGVALRSISVEPHESIDNLIRRSRRRRMVAATAITLLIAIASVATWTKLGPDVRRAVVPADDTPSTGLVTTIPFGAADLVFIGGAWGTDADVTEDDGVVAVSSAAGSARLTDLGPAAAVSSEASDPFGSLTDVPRLGPLGPLIDLSGSGTEIVAHTVIGGRQVEARGDGVTAPALAELLRSVTTASSVAPVRPTGRLVSLSDVVGLDYRDATARLESLGLRVAWTIEQSDNTAIGVVVAMSSPAATDVVAGSQIVLTVAGPQAHLRGATSSFVPVAGGDDSVGSPGYIVMDPPTLPASPEEAAANTPPPVVRLPVVFLHGELVALWSQGDPAFQAAVWLTKLTDGNYRYTPAAPPPTLPVPPLTKKIEFEGVSIDVPEAWGLASDGCPATSSIATGATPPSGCPERPPGPWISLRPAPVELTPCRPGGIGEGATEVRVCWTDNLTDGTTDEFILVGADVLMTTIYPAGDAAQPAIINAALDTLRAPAATGTTEVDSITNPTQLVAALMQGQCDLVHTLLSPESRTAVACAPVPPGTVPVDWSDFDAHSTTPAINPDDLTRDAIDITFHQGPGKGTWHVETRSYYDPATQQLTALITQVVNQNHEVVVSPSGG
jgi:hypothetical protein